MTLCLLEWLWQLLICECFPQTLYNLNYLASTLLIPRCRTVARLFTKMCAALQISRKWGARSFLQCTEVGPGADLTLTLSQARTDFVADYYNGGAMDLITYEVHVMNHSQKLQGPDS